MIPGWLRRDGATWPADAFARAGVAPFVVDYAAVHGRDAHVAGIREEIARRTGTWLALARAYDVEVGALTFHAMDRASHRFWREAYPDGDGAAPPAPESLLRAVLVGLDRALGELAASLGPEDALLVVSDHGFRAAASERHVFAGRTREHLARAGLDPARGPSGEALLDVQVLDAAPRPPGHERGLVERARQAGFRLAARWLHGARFDEPPHGFVVARFDADALDRPWPGGPIAARATRSAVGARRGAAPRLPRGPADPRRPRGRAAARVDPARDACRAAAARDRGGLAPRLAPEAELGAGSPERDDEALRERLRTLGHVE